MKILKLIVQTQPGPSALRGRRSDNAAATLPVKGR